MQPPFFGVPGIRIVGVLLIATGLVVVLNSFARFALEGLGTPAPIAPPRRLVVSGFYRYVRNPIYVAVLAMIAGQGVLLGNVELLAYGAAVWIAFHLFVVLYEEPTLRATFGADYAAYSQNVPRWVPRLRAWERS